MNIDGETYNQDFLECPYCGCINRDSWELGSGEDSGETECLTCGKTFSWTRNILTSYTGKIKK